ncbi:MAG: efflux RND transporter periplasmic adaptor subunit [Chloroflexota bacterium]
MNKRVIFIFGLVAVLAISVAGYAGAATNTPPTPTPTPETIEVTRCDVEQTVTAPGALQNISERQLLMPVDGSLADVLVRAGDSVTAGQVLARVNDGARVEAQIALKDAQAAYQTAFNYRKSLEGKIWLDRITYRAGDRGQQIPIHHWYRGYADPSTIEDADHNLALKKAELDEAQATLDQMELKAPFDGILIEVDAAVGQVYHESDALFKMIDPKALEVKANITEEDFPLVVIGQAVELFFDARPDVSVLGTVERIIPMRADGDSPRYDIYISLDEVPDGLADGMTVDAAVTIAKRENVLCLPRAVVRASGEGRSVLKVWNGIDEETREIQVGLRGDTYVEIISGLEEGEQVVTK